MSCSVPYIMSCFLLHVSQSVLLILSRIGLLPVPRSVTLHSVDCVTLCSVFLYRSVSIADQRPVERIMGHAYSAVQESVRSPST